MDITREDFYRVRNPVCCATDLTPLALTHPQKTI
jgi:hypothetical protein